jgi:putative membrane protein
VKLWLRWTADALAIYLALYLLDSVAKGRFQVRAAWAALILALLLGLLDSFWRPLHRVRSKPFLALLAAVLTLLVNALILQTFVWVGAELATTSFVWIPVAGALLSLLTGVINWLVGFRSKERTRPAARARAETRPREPRPTRAPRTRA